MTRTEGWPQAPPGTRRGPSSHRASLPGGLSLSHPRSSPLCPPTSRLPPQGVHQGAGEGQVQGDLPEAPREAAAGRGPPGLHELDHPGRGHGRRGPEGRFAPQGPAQRARPRLPLTGSPGGPRGRVTGLKPSSSPRPSSCARGTAVLPSPPPGLLGTWSQGSRGIRAHLGAAVTGVPSNRPFSRCVQPRGAQEPGPLSLSCPQESCPWMKAAPTRRACMRSRA